MKNIGIIGGGQLGRMAIPDALRLNIRLKFLDVASATCAQASPHFHVGDFCSDDDIVAFGRDCVIVSYEREDISLSGLRKLEEMGVQVHPSSSILELTQNKLAQKVFFNKHGFPNSKLIAKTSIDFEQKNYPLPVVAKSLRGGYDGSGVEVLKSSADATLHCRRLSQFNQQKKISKTHEFFYEEYQDQPRELAVLVAQNGCGETFVYDAVEMFFHPQLNCMDYLIAPAKLESELSVKIRELAFDLMSQLKVRGLLAIELFLNQSGQILINEIAARPHNSGHHTLNATSCSQFEQWLRAINGWPLGDGKLLSLCMSMNVLGAKDASEQSVLIVSPLLALPSVFVHMYGKKMLPNRKLGHINILAKDRQELLTVRSSIQNMLRHRIK